MAVTTAVAPLARLLLTIGFTVVLAVGCSSSSNAPSVVAMADGSDLPDGKGASSDAEAEGRDAGEDADVLLGDAAIDVGDALSAYCSLAVQPIALPSGSVTGILTGGSRNPAVSCAPGMVTPGPDVILSLELDKFTIVDLRVDAPIDTFISVRTGCGADVTEVGCSAHPPRDGAVADAGVSDGGAPTDARMSDDATSGVHTSGLRVGLPAGRYTVIIDTIFLGELTSAPFTFTATAVAPTVNALCAGATMLGAATPTAHGQLDLGEPGTGCNAAPGGTLFYAVQVPSGQSLTADATVTAGDRAWMPQLAALGACEATTCAQGNAIGGADEQLNWLNNDAEPRLIILSVAADGPVTGAEFDIEIGVTDLLTSCARPTPVEDGTTLHHQSLANVPPVTNMTCVANTVSALYYVATLLPEQELDVTGGGNTNVALRTSCDDPCMGKTIPAKEIAKTINLSASPEDILIEVTSPTTTVPFDLSVSQPPPLAGVDVTPTIGLVTTEGGGQATFTVVLTSPPAASVDLTLTSSRPSEGTVSPGTLAFDATNWSTPQTVTITGVDDHVSDGSQEYQIVSGPVVSTDARYDGLDGVDVAVTNLDDEPGLTVADVDELVTSEDGASATFTIRLTTLPADTVSVPLASSDVSHGVVAPATLTFTTADWNVPQTVTVTGVDDGIPEGPQPYAISLGPLASNDDAYNGLTPGSVSVTNRDDDIAPVATEVVQSSDTCGTAGTPNQFPLAVDALGQLYFAVYCNSQLDIVTSADGGRTLSDLTPLPGVTSLSGDFAMAAGPGGTAYVAYGLDAGGLGFARTADAGVTWSQRTLAASQIGSIHMGAARDTVVIVVDSEVVGGENSTSLVVRSLDGGRSFFPATGLSTEVKALGIHSDGQSVWLVDNQGVLWKSGDAGATFVSLGSIVDGPTGCCYVFGSDDVYWISNSEQLGETRLADGVSPDTVTANVGTPLAVAIDDTNVLTIFASTATNLLGTRYGPAMILGTPDVVGPQADMVGAVALSRRAIAIVSLSAAGVQFSVAAWP